MTPSELQTVDIYDGDALLGHVDIDGGRWTLPVTGLTAGTHQFKAVYDKLSSNRWSVVHEPYQIDLSLMTLDGFAVMVPWPLSNVDLPGNTQIRQPTGGVPPYTYTSSRPDIASVDSSGKVRGLLNGTATISVKDAEQRSLSYTVNVANIWRLTTSTGPFYATDALAWIRAQGGTDNFGLIMGLIEVMKTQYVAPIPPNHTQNEYYWLTLYQSPNTYAFFHFSYQWVNTVVADDPSVRGAWCFTST